jgi:hypothetical protein
MQGKHLISVAVVGLCAAASAHADPISDFKFGTTVHVRSASITVDDNQVATGGISITKPANTLTFDVPASAIGSPLPITLHLVGTQVGPNVVQYTFNWSGNVDIDGEGDMLTYAYGFFLATFTPAPPDVHTFGNVAIEVTPFTSYIVAQGDWGTKMLYVTRGSFYGGFLPATLSGYGRSSNDVVCSDTTPVKVKMYADINNPAPPTGQWVFLTSAYHQGVSVPPIVVVPPGKKFVLFDATVAPSFSGTVSTMAVSGGGIGTYQLEIDPHADCESSGGDGPPVAYNPDQGCIQCTIFRAINDWNERLGLVGREHVYINGTTVTPLASMFAAQAPSAITAVAMSNSGYITGMATIGGVTSAYRANVDREPGTLELLGAITPRAIGELGTVVGYRLYGTSQTRAAVSYGRGVIDVPLPSSFDVYSSAAVAINNAADIVGTFTKSPGGAVHGFRYSGGVAVELPDTAAIPVAVDDTGTVAANGIDSRGALTAALVSARGTVTLLGNPRGYAGFQITSMNKYGFVVGVATSIGTTPVRRAFAWTPVGGFRALSGYRRELPVVDYAYAITDANAIAVHATDAAGVPNLFILPL